MVCDRVIVLFLVAVAGTTYAMRLNGGERNRREGENQETPLFRAHTDLNFEGNFEAKDNTARMDLVKSIDDIIQSPYSGPYLTSLDPLLVRQNFKRPARESTSQRRPSFSSGNFQKNSFGDFSRNRQSIPFFRPSTPLSEESNRSPVRASHFQPSSRPNNRHRDQGFSSPHSHRFGVFSDDFTSPFESEISSPSAPKFSNSFSDFSSSSSPFNEPSSSRFSEVFQSGVRERNPEFQGDFETFVRKPLTRNRRDLTSQNRDIATLDFNFPSHVSEQLADDTEHLKDTLFDNSPLARQESQGFIIGRPSNFPSFQSVGGFGPMDAEQKSEMNFVQEFEMPSVSFPDLDEKQPKIGPENFPTQQSKNSTNTSSAESQKERTEKELNYDETLAESISHIRVKREGGVIPQEPIYRTRLTRPFAPFSFFEFHPGTREQSRREQYHVLHDDPPRQPQSEEAIVSEGQRYYPPFDPRPPKRASHSFYPSEQHPAARGGGGPAPFSNRRPGFRSHGANEAVHNPKFAFASNKFTDFGPVDNSLLGSGNFEIIKGGTFYDDDNPHRNHHPFDPYLDNSYVVFPSGSPHHHNHVDDFFQNFRDFSEFATRRSGTVHYGTGEGDGTASEHVAQVSPLEDMMFSETEKDPSIRLIKIPVKSLGNDSSNKTVSQKAVLMLGNKTLSSKIDKKSKKVKKAKVSLLKKQSNKDKSKKPKNIQEVLAEMDSSPSDSSQTTSSNLTTEEDPLIATF